MKNNEALDSMELSSKSSRIEEIINYTKQQDELLPLKIEIEQRLSTKSNNNNNINNQHYFESNGNNRSITPN